MRLERSLQSARPGGQSSSCSPLCPAHPEGDPGLSCSVPSLKIESRDPATPQGRSRPCKETDPLGADRDRDRHRALRTALVAGGSPSGHMQDRSSQRLLVKASRSVREPLLGLSTPGRRPEPTGQGTEGHLPPHPTGSCAVSGEPDFGWERQEWQVQGTVPESDGLCESPRRCVGYLVRRWSVFGISKETLKPPLWEK